MTKHDCDKYLDVTILADAPKMIVCRVCGRMWPLPLMWSGSIRGLREYRRPT